MPVLCLVPTPLAASRAARRLCDAQGGVLFGPAVGTLERLVPGLLAAAGDRRAVLSPLAERVLAAAAGAAAGGPFAALEPGDGLAAALASALAELRRGEVSARDLRGAAATLQGAPSTRLGALAAALEAYEARLSGLSAVDRAGALRAAADAVARGAASPETAGLDLLVVDGLVAVAPAEWDLLAALVGRARRTRVHLPFYPGAPGALGAGGAAAPSARGAPRAVGPARLEVVLPRLEGDGRARLPAALLAAFAGGGAAMGTADAGEGRVLALAGAGEAGEAEAAASAVATLLAAGHAPEDVALVSPAPGRSAAALARALAAQGIPLDAGRGAPLAEAPVVRRVREALAAAGDLSRSAAERLLGSAWLGAGGPPIGALLNRAGALDGRARAGGRAAAARGGARGRRGRGGARGAAARGRGGGGARGRAPAARRAGTAREHAARLSAFLARTGIHRRAARGEAG